MLTIYVVSAGAMWREALNGTVTFLGSSSFETLIRIAGTFSVLTAAMAYSKTRSPQVFLKWLVIYFLITICMLAPKSSVQVIDLSDPSQVYEVDNVPLSLAYVASLSTTIGYATASRFEEFISTPDSMSYTKTGMSFGASLVGDSGSMPSNESPFSGNISTFISKCSVPDMLINHKYTLTDIYNSQNPEVILFQNPSPIISMPFTDTKGNTNIMTCKEAATKIQQEINSPLVTFASSLHRWKTTLFGSNQNQALSLENYVQDSTQQFYGAGKSQTDLLKRNIMSSAISNGISQLQGEARNSAMASIIAEQQTAQKMKLQGSIERDLGMRVMPLVHSVLELFLICLFPLVIAVALISHEEFGMRTIKTYIMSWFCLQMWPIMFSLINFFGVSWLKAHLTQLGGGGSMSDLNQSTDYYSDMSSIMGYLCLSIPVLSGLITKGVSTVAAQGIGSMSGALGMGAGSSASQAADGNWSLNNMSMDNVNSNKFNTNTDIREGMQTRQIANGALASENLDGNHVINADGAISRLPTNISMAGSMAATKTEQARVAQQEASSHLQGYNHSVDSVFSQVQDLSHQGSHGVSSSSGSESSQSTSTSQAASHLMDMVNNYSHQWGVGKDVAFNRLFSSSSGYDIGVGVSSGASMGGDGINAGAKGSLDGKSGHVLTNNTTGGQSRTDRDSVDVSAADRKDFRETVDKLQQARNYEGGNKTDSTNDTLTNRLDNSLRTANSEYQQYTASQTQSQELSKQAAFIESNSSGYNANMNQEFVNWARERGATDKELSTVNMQTPMVQEFMREKLNTPIGDIYNQEKSDVMRGSGVNSSVPHGNDGDFEKRSQNLNNQAEANSVPQHVNEPTHRDVDTSKINDIKEDVSDTSDHLKAKSSGASQEFEKSASDFRKRHGKWY
ncbi:conjugal transfer mating-pair stabilization protein TraG [Rosenbergiella collisarenosi]|uniref:conjugal transfer mating-pair stabilization protein TraG n=1 Tax=Rosenbergiella collisarenosi TaxID=1544695 RepID=UPI001F4DBD88|nr:conjugal transfer mating-pair stabilization protein TraG [Rosenbergiella collisarenosi]